MAENVKELAKSPKLAEFNLTVEDLKDPETREAFETFLEAEREERRRKCKEDVFFLANEILGYKDLDGNNEDYRHIDLMLDRKLGTAMDKPFNMVLIPRTCLKSTLITKAKVIQRILRNGDVRILITSAVLKQSIDFLSEIKQKLESPPMVELFGNLKGRFWRENEITVAHRRIHDKEKTIEVGSPDHTLTGKHYDFIIADDLVTRANILTADSCNAIYLYFKDLLDLLEHPNGMIDIVGTRWSFSDMYGRILDPDNGHLDFFNTLVLGCYNEDGSARFPKKLPLKEINIILKNKNDDLEFSAQYLNDPVPSGTATFKPDYFKHNKYNKNELPADLPTYVLCDPAATKNKKSDYTAILIIKVGDDGTWYLWDAINDKFSPGTIEKLLFELYIKYKPVKLAVEQVGFAAYIKTDLDKIMLDKQTFFHITELETHGRNKDDRIRGLQPLFEYGRIKFPRGGIKYIKPDTMKEMDMIFALKDELIKFPMSHKKDLADTLAYMKDIVMPPNQRVVVEKGYEGSDNTMRREIELRKIEAANRGKAEFFGDDVYDDDIYN
jgi:predicted phage terminase large subunit-like protein